MKNLEEDIRYVVKIGDQFLGFYWAAEMAVKFGVEINLDNGVVRHYKNPLFPDRGKITHSMSYNMKEWTEEKAIRDFVTTCLNKLFPLYKVERL